MIFCIGSHSLDDANITRRDQGENVQIIVDIKYDFPGVICQNNTDHLLKHASAGMICIYLPIVFPLILDGPRK
jgi:hypothetical protein